MRKELGKITQVRCGIGGYQDTMLGIGFTIEGKGWGVQTPFEGTWSPDSIKVDKHTKWTEKDRSLAFDNAFRLIGSTLHKAKKKDISELVGVPVEVVFEDNTLISWRVLTEVL